MNGFFDPLKLHASRRQMQYFVLLVLVLIPLTGLFRIDVEAGGFVILGRQIWFSDILIVMGFWVMVVSFLVMTYSAVGAVFCGWVCPQNTISEWANDLTQKLLGRRAKTMDMSGVQMNVAVRKRSPLNIIVLYGLFFLVSMFYALIPLLYFFPPSAIGSFLLLQNDERLAGSIYWIYFMFVVVVFLDIALIRHLWCRYMCIYRVWQHSFKTKETLRVAFDTTRADECGSCQLCTSHCFLDLNPKKTEEFDSCINCGECIDVCASMNQKKSRPKSALLSFAWGSDESRSAQGTALGGLLARSKVVLFLALLGTATFALGLFAYQPASLSVYHSQQEQGAQIHEYRINVANKLYQPMDMKIAIEGLQPEDYQLSMSAVHFETTGRKNIILSLNRTQSPGIHRFMVVADNGQGWSHRFEVRHFSMGVDSE